MLKLNIFLILILIVIVCCKSKINTTNAQTDTDVKIIKLDSLESVYIYYCKTEGNDNIYRILTPKKKSSCKNTIVLSKVYKIKLHDVSSPIYNPQIKGFWFNNTRIPIKDKSGKSSPMYTTDNIKGLCYIK